MYVYFMGGLGLGTDGRTRPSIYIYKLAHPTTTPLHPTHATRNSFTVGLEGAREGGFGLLVNDEKTRSFLTVGVGVGCDERLRRLVASVDAVLERYRQPTYYADPKFHVSVASLRGDVAAVWGAGEGDGEEEEEGAEATAVVVDTVECRVGHKLFEIPLRVL